MLQQLLQAQLQASTGHIRYIHLLMCRRSRAPALTLHTACNTSCCLTDISPVEVVGARVAVVTAGAAVVVGMAVLAGTDVGTDVVGAVVMAVVDAGTSVVAGAGAGAGTGASAYGHCWGPAPAQCLHSTQNYAAPVSASAMQLAARSPMALDSNFLLCFEIYLERL